MIDSFVKNFDYSDFEKKLRHYFSDSCPIYVSIKLFYNKIKITNRNGISVVYYLSENSIFQNIKELIHSCELNLYPKMIEISEQKRELSEEQKKLMLFQGLSLEQINEKSIRRIQRNFTIIRFNSTKNSIDYREDITGNVFRAFLNRPLLMCRDSLLSLSMEGREGEQKLYQFILNNSKIENITIKENSK